MTVVWFPSPSLLVHQAQLISPIYILTIKLTTCLDCAALITVIMGLSGIKHPI